MVGLCTRNLLKWDITQKHYCEQNFAVVDLFDREKIEMSLCEHNKYYSSSHEHTDQWIYVHVILV
jgi:hypothetical protein